ncbi:ATP-binding protein [Pseudoroseicyclus aestuarii]|uniref:histidine kinase n=1 Tax=Pseudoroseicyclus aestuarii TaxID=1795041 RepID=A0A318SM52_9RHOB|nr:ATP-binding protein [Pseudoroseicyclus aestuarii]PYE80904.1 two-component system osmolarity sensor histidine kinase EnvZ [Pseudoroseicyclus aestuarii]
MRWGWLKRTLPRSLFGRAALIVVLPVLILQLVISILFVQRHFEGVTQQMTRSVILELRYLEAAVAAAPDLPAARAAAASIAAPLEMTVFLPAGAAPRGDPRALFDLPARTLAQTLRAGVPGLVAVDTDTDRRAVRLWLQTPRGLMQVAFDRRRVSARNPHQLIVIIIVLGALLMAIASVFLRNQLRPIARLSEAATEYGKGRRIPYRASGATEVRAAGAAFIDMRARIERQNQARTMMLSGVSHDLRTPLTRLRLGLSMLEDEAEAAPLIRDVDEMQGLTDSFLDFARGDAEDAVEIVDPIALVRMAVEDAQRGGQEIALVQAEGQGAMPLRPVAIRRALSNLIGNALRHGSRAEIGVVLNERALRIIVEDDGPGIPAEQREEAMRPFTRLDASRNQDRGGGVGLGLAIVIDVARGHGGSLRLDDSPRLGGLLAELIVAR